MSSTGESDNKVQLENPYLTDKEFLYHLFISTSVNLPQRFGDVKYVCMGGKSSRMRNFAELLYDELGQPDNSEVEENSSHGFSLKDIAAAGGRYSMFKVGPVISVNHGIGMASMSVVLHEVLKLVHYARCTDVKFFRLGTSGGLGIDGGTVVVTDKAYNSLLENCYVQVACGKEIRYESKTDSALAKELLETAKLIKVPAISGNTMATHDFYEEQARLDGALCSFTLEEKMEFLNRAHDQCGIRNIEMESTCFTAMCHRAGVKCGVVCAALLNRLMGDEVTSDKEQLAKWDLAPQRIVSAYIKRKAQGADQQK